MAGAHRVGLGEVGVGHEYLAAYLNSHRFPELSPAARQPGGLGGDVLTGPAVAAGGDQRQSPGDVAGSDREAVDLRLDRVPAGGLAEQPLQPGRPFAQRVFAEHVVQALVPWLHRFVFRPEPPAGLWVPESRSSPLSCGSTAVVGAGMLVAWPCG